MGERIKKIKDVLTSKLPLQKTGVGSLGTQERV